ncbi:Mur ligase domain-containing protein [Streptomyces sp. Lzd4kr]|nr:Mur ligase domain-containing protein [Streptomyces sp. Lzd4kr]
MVETAVPRITPDVPATGLVDLRRVHFVGIGGMGMLPVARVCAERGYTVSGSDARPSVRLEALAQCGVRVVAGQRESNVPADATAVVFTHAVGADNPEIVHARKLGIPVVHRSTVLRTLMAGHPSVAVMGTHGKSSTSAMIAFALARLGQDPSYVVGADLDLPGSGGHAGAGGLFVAEVDESDRTHIGMSMDVAVITNIAHDHPENYADEGDVVRAFEECVARGLAGHGTLILNADSAGCRELAARLAQSGPSTKVVMVGESSDADWRLSQVSGADGRPSAVLSGPDGVNVGLTLRVPGVHQLMNAAAALVTLHTLCQDLQQAAVELSYFDGAQRRMTSAGEAAGVRVYDSFAHHPDEVSADLAAARSLADVTGGKVIVAFQPPDSRRLEVFGDAFAQALSACDHLILTDGTHGLPASALRGLSARVDAARGHAGQVVPERAEASACTVRAARPGDVVVLMGAGDIAESGPQLLATLAAPALASA